METFVFLIFVWTDKKYKREFSNLRRLQSRYPQRDLILTRSGEKRDNAWILKSHFDQTIRRTHVKQIVTFDRENRR